MKEYRTSIRLLLLMSINLLVSCEYELDIPNSSEPYKLCINGFPAAAIDTSFFEVSIARPIGSERRVVSPGDINVMVRRNGNACKAGLYSKDRQSNRYYIDARIESGDIIELSAGCSDFGTVSAVSVVPEPPVFRVDQLSNHLIFPPSPDGYKRYYGVRISKRRVIEEVDWGHGFREYTSKEDIEQVQAYGSSPVTIPDMDIHNIKTILPVSVNGEQMLIFEDFGDSPDSLVITVDLSMMPNGFVAQDYWRDTLTVQRFLRVEAFSISEMAYKYLNPQINRTLLNVGLIPPFIGSGNIEGGFGVFSCMGKTDTGWLPNKAGIGPYMN